MFSVTIRVAQTPWQNNVGSWEKKTQLHSVPRVGETVYVEDYSWGCHIGREGVEVIGVCHGLADGMIIVDIEDITDRGALHSVDGWRWTEKGSVVFSDVEGAPTHERDVLLGFTQFV